jgi:hypothetical protein
MRGPSPCKKRKISSTSTPAGTHGSVTGSNMHDKTAATQEEVQAGVPQIRAKVTRSKAKDMPNPAGNTRSKRAKL